MIIEKTRLSFLLTHHYDIKVIMISPEFLRTGSHGPVESSLIYPWTMVDLSSSFFVCLPEGRWMFTARFFR